MKERFAQLFATEGLPYGDTERTMTYNSRFAQELGKWAETQPQGADAFHDAMFKAYFVHAKNIGDIDTLVGIAEEAGYDGAEARKALENREFKAAVDDDWRRARRAGITGVPTFLINGMRIVGAQPYERLVLLMEKAGIPQRT